MADSEEKPPSNSHDDNQTDKVEKSIEQVECCCLCFPKRYFVALMTFMGFALVYMLRVNLSVAIVDMVQNKTRTHSNGTVYLTEPEYDWDSATRGIVLSSFFYGYIFTQIPGGYLAIKFGGKITLGLGVLVPALLTLITPLAVRGSVYLLIVARILEGLFEGLTFPSLQAIWYKWAPPLERSVLPTISFSGVFIGTVLGLSLSGVITHSLGWEWVFYIFGLLGIIWSFFWFRFITDSPADHPKITKKEKDYIMESLANDHGKEDTTIPWLKILTSVPFWAFVIAQTSEFWGFYFLLTELPSYLKVVLKLSVIESGVMSAVPYLFMAVVVQCAGRIADFLRQKSILSTTNVRKLFNTIGFLSQSIFLFIVGNTDDKKFAVIGLCFAVGLGGCAWSGFGVNSLDLSPRHAAFLFGIANTFATIPGMVSPIITGVLTPHDTQEEWRRVFYGAAAVYLFGMLVFVGFGTGEKQSWSDLETTASDTHQPIEEKKRLLDDIEADNE